MVFRLVASAELDKLSLEAGRCDLAEESHDSACFAVVNECALCAHEFVRARREKEHVPGSKQQFAALLIEDDSAVHPAGDLERHPPGHVGFDEPRHHVCLRTLCRKNEVNPHRASLLCDADDRPFHFFVRHHHVGEFVDDEDDVRQFARDACSLQFRRGRHPFEKFFFVKLVVAHNVAHARLCEQFVPFVHLADRPFEDRSSTRHLRHHRAHQVRNIAERSKLDHLGIDQNQLQFVGFFRKQKTHDDRVEADTLARAGRPGNQHMGHRSEVFDQRLATRILAQEHRQAHLRHVVSVRSTGHQLFEADFFFLEVGHFDADRVASRHVGDDADVDCLERAGDVARDGVELAHLRSRRQTNFIQRDDRPGVNPHDFAFDAVHPQCFFERFCLLADKLLHLLGVRLFGIFEEVDAGEAVVFEVHRVLDVAQLFFV